MDNDFSYIQVSVLGQGQHTDLALDPVCPSNSSQPFIPFPHCSLPIPASRLCPPLLGKPCPFISRLQAAPGASIGLFLEATSTSPHFSSLQTKDNRDFGITSCHFGIRLLKPEDLRLMKDLGSLLLQNLQLVGVGGGRMRWAILIGEGHPLIPLPWLIPAPPFFLYLPDNGKLRDQT